MYDLAGRRILLIVSGGIAAYKCLELIRRLREAGASVRCVLTEAAQQFVTPMSVAAISEAEVFTTLFSLKNESEMGHIRLSREADLVVAAPATADLLARMAAGMADDLATTALLATDKPVLAAPAMNVRMWEHPATQANLATLRARGIGFIGPNEGDMACGEFGFGRMAEPDEIAAAIRALLGAETHGAPARPLAGRRALVTSGPTREPLDPVRYLSNRSSGRQGHAIAAALARLGAATTLVTGPTAQPAPPNVEVVAIETAREMLAACERALPVDVAVCAAAVSDWRVDEPAVDKIKKSGGSAAPSFRFVENPDILASLSRRQRDRPRLVVGFAAETTHVIENAAAKRLRKGCDWILANDVSEGTGTFGGGHNTIRLIAAGGVEDWPQMTKEAVAERLAARIADRLRAEAGASGAGASAAGSGSTAGQGR
jgi:phosphopantothenoylcysteine decarboxylase/phosphopantothenate--cysteine ligase